MSNTPETDSYADRDWWTLFRANEHARELERERDEARKELEEYRSIAENIGAVKAVSEKEKAICERDEANEELHKQLVRYDQLFDEAEKIRIERDKVRTELEEAQLCLKKAITELDLASVEIFKWERDFMIVVNDFKTVVKQLNK